MECKCCLSDSAGQCCNFCILEPVVQCEIHNVYSWSQQLSWDGQHCDWHEANVTLLMWCKMCCYKYISDQRHSQIIWMNMKYWKTSCSPFPISGWRRLWLLAGAGGGRRTASNSPLTYKTLPERSPNLQTSSSHQQDSPTYKISKPLAPTYKTPPGESPWQLSRPPSL